MIDRLLNIIAPHHCYGCGKMGALLCHNCKYDIITERFLRCLACGKNSSGIGVCADCSVPYSRAWCVSEREGVLQRLIGGYKFQYVRAASVPLAELLHKSIGQLPRETIIVPIPTVATHIRERGFDHAALLARRLAALQGVACRPLLRRVTNTKQRDASRRQRFDQAKIAFEAGIRPQGNVPYLLVDDVVTTGATVQYGAQVLKDAGATEIWVAAIARQILD